MSKVLLRIFLALLLAALAAGGWALCRHGDPFYQAQEWLFNKRFHQYDALIREISQAQNMDPMLVKAVIWRESAFDETMRGRNGERGLMQVTEPAAKDWARVEHAQFKPEELFDPRTNLEIGTWYLRKALDRYQGRDEPVPFALAAYNAGKSRVDRWIASTNHGPQATGTDLRTNIDFPSTKKYVRSIEQRYAFYKARGRL
jgi:soluble lytic murein transglycosylase